MITSCLGVVVKRGGLLFVLTASLPTSLFAQVDSTVSSTVMLPPRQNAWVSVGLGVGKGGIAGVTSAWYSHNHLVVGAHAADVAQLWGPDVHDVALMVGVRDLGPHGVVVIAAGPAKLGGQLFVGNPYVPRTVPRHEFGMAVAVETIFTLPIVGIGLDGFVARSQNRLVEGVTLSVQVGWFGI